MIHNMFQSKHSEEFDQCITGYAITVEVSIHAPQRVRHKQISIRGGNIVSIHAPTKGATALIATVAAVDVFQSTHP